jgi:sugar O-acyltransferase (sialic acid O-acetyltransferase NeuD family)
VSKLRCVNTPDIGRVTRPVVIVGCGGHAIVLIEALRRSGADIVAAIDHDSAKHGQDICGVRVAGGDEALLGHHAGSIYLVNAVGSVGVPRARKAVFERLKQAGYEFATVVHPGAIVASDALLGEGVQIMAGAVVQPRCAIGANTIVNTRAAIDHDGRIGAHVHVAPGATVCGDVAIGDECHIGAGATLIQGIRLTAGCTVGAGAVVLRDIDEPGTFCGVPAKRRPA